MDACMTCGHEHNGTPCHCRPHPDPHIQMGRTLIDAEAMHTPFTAGPAWTQRHARPLPPAAELGARLWRVHGNSEGVEAYIDAVRRAAAVESARDRAQDARRAGL